MTPTSIASERRRHQRQKLLTGMRVELRVEVSGVNPAILLTRGEAVDISCGGVACATDLAVPVGTHVDIHFPAVPMWVSMEPRTASGRVVRSELFGGAPGRIVIAFSEPLRRLEVALRDHIRSRIRPSAKPPTAAATTVYDEGDRPRVFYAAGGSGNLH